MFSKNKIEVFIDGMKCSHCEKRIKETLLQDKDIKKVTTNLEKKMVTIISNKEIAKEKIKEKIEDLEYKVIEIK